MNTEEKRFHAAVAAMRGLLTHADWISAGWVATADASIDMADELLEKLDKRKPEPKADALPAELDATAVVKESLTPQPQGFPDFQKWTAYEGLGTIKEGDEDIFAHRNLSSLTERHNRAIASIRAWAMREAESPQPEADGWIAHKPGDPVPCEFDLRIDVKIASGIIRYGQTAEFWRGLEGDGGNWSDCGEFSIVAWRPAENLS